MRSTTRDYKKSIELIKDTIREANTLPRNPAPEKENLDIIKHLIKRLAIHQILLEEKANKTNCWLLILTIILTIAVLPTLMKILMDILRFFKILG